MVERMAGRLMFVVNAEGTVAGLEGGFADGP